MKKSTFFNRIRYRIDKLKRKRNRRRLDKALETIRDISKDSYLVKHFLEEARIAWDLEKDRNEGGMQDLMISDMTDILSLISTQGDSGFSIGYKRRLLDSALDYGLIAPLSFKEDEFNRLSYRDGGWQNRRLSSVFKDDDGRIYDIDALNHRIVAEYDISDGSFSRKDGGVWHGGKLILYKDGEFFKAETKIINMNTYMGDNCFAIPCLEVVDRTYRMVNYMFNVALYDMIPETFFKDYDVYEEKGSHTRSEVQFCCDNKERILECLEKVREEF